MTRFLFLSLTLLLLSCSGEQKNAEALKMSAAERQVYLDRGNEIAQGSFKALSTKLKEAMVADGLEGAIKTCNVHALPLTDSLARAYNASVKRTSLRVRNPDNEATLEEKHIFKLYQKAKNNGQELEPLVLLVDSSTVHYFSPIFTKALCLNCHGEPGSSMTEENAELLRSYYPTDKAIGYKLDELRGIWSIEFQAN